jgi:CpeS-like protein
MSFSVQTVAPLEALAAEFFQCSEGKWRSQRRYYTLKSGEVQEIESQITVRFLPLGDDKLIHLAELHGLEASEPLLFGAETTWDSTDTVTQHKQSSGSTVFGVRGNLLYRDRGFATPKPITAEFLFRDERTMQLRTEYGGSAFEEELKLIGSHYRTRQTIISRAGEEIMIGQYLENRID